MKTEHRTEGLQAPGTPDPQWELLWAVRLSIRYHRLRERWMDAVNRWCAFLTGATGAGIVASLLTGVADNPTWLVAAAAIGATAGMVQLAFGLSGRARLHSELAHDFTLLERDIVIAGDDLSEAEARDFQARRLEIESREPPVLYVLSTMCHNELVTAYGVDAGHRTEPRWYQRWLADVMDVGASELQRQA